LIDEIDVDNWVIDDIKEPKEFQTNPPSLDVKQTRIFEKKQDLNVVFKSFLIEDDIMEFMVVEFMEDDIMVVLHL
jgi:hypothetical protein